MMMTNQTAAFMSFVLIAFSLVLGGCRLDSTGPSKPLPPDASQSTNTLNGDHDATVVDSEIAVELAEGKSDEVAKLQDRFARKNELHHQVHLIETDHLELKDWISQQPGELFFVDFWATWCGPCVKHFPLTVQLHERHHDRGLVVISVSLDEIEEQAEVVEFLQSHQATFAHMIRRLKIGDAFEDFSISQLPHYRLYDKSGTIVAELSGEQPAEALDLFIRQHLDR